MGRNLLVTIGAIIFGICGTVYAGETEIILKDSSSNSGFSVKNGNGGFLMRVQGDGKVSMGQLTTASGDTSTAMGFQTIASGDISTVIGFQSTASGNNSTAMGRFATASGAQSTAMGRASTAIGDRSTAMGSNTIASSFAETAIGSFNTDYTPVSANTFETADRLFVIGNGTNGSNRSDAMVVLKNGNTGIGTSNPSNKLSFGVGDLGIAIESADGSDTGRIILQGAPVGTGGRGAFVAVSGEEHATPGELRLAAGNSGNVVITNGNLGIGRTDPAHPIHMNSGAHVTSGGVWTNASSREYKENIKTLSLKNAINTLNELNPVTFNYKIDKSENYVGFVAEDVPELVSTQDRKGLSPMDITAVLTKVVKEQQEMLNAQQEIISLLLDKVNQIESRI